jgi:uncharacterized protein YjhX (UPF0386 family)
MECVQNGECCAIVGVGSVGKSNLLRHLIHEKVIQHYLGENAQYTLFLNIDANALIEESVWGFYELMFHRLLQATESLDPGWGERFGPLYEKAIDSDNDRLARRYMERMVSALRGAPHHYRLVFLMDEFDEVFRGAEGALFAGLRALRDDHKYNLVYVVFGREELSQAHEIEGPYEAFYELVYLNTFGLGPYGEKDARHMLTRLASRRNRRLDEETAKAILMATQSHPGLVRAATWAVLDGRADPKRDDLGLQLLSDRNTRDEYHKIWDGLSQQEQRILHEIAQGGPWIDTNERSFKFLELKQIVTQTGGQPRIFSEHFATYVRDDAKTIRLRIGWHQRIVQRGPDLIKNILPNDFEVLAYLYQNRDRVCTREEIINQVWKSEAIAATRQKLQATIGRLRRQIEPEPKRPVYLVTHGDKGYQLENC